MQEMKPKTGAISGTQSEKAISGIFYCIIAGCLGIILFDLQTRSTGAFLAMTGICFLIAGAWILIGAMLGFLFGIPRTLQEDKGSKDTKPESDEEGKRDMTSYRANTNLEQISDWLTKILVGVGLTQIGSLPGNLKKYAKFASFGFGDISSKEIFMVAILFFYIICGFLLSYLWTRLYFAGALIEAERASRLEKVEIKVSELEKQSEIDAKALGTVQRQLNPNQGAISVDQRELSACILPASDFIKVQIFYQARNLRSLNWEEPQKKPIMEKTIPVFRALVASDMDGVYHMNHGQLGFALKDQRNPNWAEAEKELSKAIEIRGPSQAKDWWIYEFNRAICRIVLDPNFKAGLRSSDEEKKSIMNDLQIASKANRNQLTIEEPYISKWLELNK